MVSLMSWNGATAKYANPQPSCMVYSFNKHRFNAVRLETPCSDVWKILGLNYISEDLPSVRNRTYPQWTATKS